MQSAAKPLACIATQNRCNDWIPVTCEMLRSALHDRSYLGTSPNKSGASWEMFLPIRITGKSAVLCSTGTY